MLLCDFCYTNSSYVLLHYINLLSNICSCLPNVKAVFWKTLYVLGIFIKLENFSILNRFFAHLNIVNIKPFCCEVSHPKLLFKPGARPQPAEGRLWACAWFTEIVFVKVCVCTYLPMFVRTHPREQNRLITVKAAFT